MAPFFHENKFVTDFTKKTELLNSCFAKLDIVINDSNSVPLSPCLKQIIFARNYILKIIHILDSKKAHCHE